MVDTSVLILKKMFDFALSCTKSNKLNYNVFVIRILNYPQD